MLRSKSSVIVPLGPITVIVNLVKGNAVVCAIGVPDTTPVVELNVNPVGSVEGESVIEVIVPVNLGSKEKGSFGMREVKVLLPEYAEVGVSLLVEVVVVVPVLVFVLVFVLELQCFEPGKYLEKLFIKKV